MPGISYVKMIGAGLVLLAVIWLGIYIMTLRSERDDALVKAAGLQATVNELQAVHANDVKALAELETAKAQSEAALLADAAKQQTIVQTVTQWKERVVHVPVASTACRAVDARDAAVLDGVRGILAAAADPNPHGQDPAAGGAPGGHPAPRPAIPAAKPG